MNQKHLYFLTRKPNVFNRWVAMGGVPDLRDNHHFPKNMSGANLTGARMQRAVLGGISARNATLDRATLRGATIVNSTLYQASMSEVDMGMSRVSGVSFVGACLIGTNVDNAQFRDCNFFGAVTGFKNAGSADFSDCQNIFTALGIGGYKCITVTRWLDGVRIDMGTHWGTPQEVAEEIEVAYSVKETRRENMATLERVIQHCQLLGWLS